MKINWRWSIVCGVVGYLVLHPFVMMVAFFMFESRLDPSYAISDVIASQAWMSFSLKMLPWSLAFAIFSALIGHFYGRIRIAEEALRESEERFRNMAAAAHDAILVMDSKGIISYWNQAAERILGYLEKEAIGKDAYELVVSERSVGAFQEEFRSLKLTGKSIEAGKTLDLWAVRRDGTVFPMELSLSSFQLQGEWHALGIIRDISERKRAEQERLQREKLQGVIEMAGAACHELNQPMQSILGYSELVLKDMLEDRTLYERLKMIKGQIDRMQETTKKIMRITKYETRDYTQGVKIIDIDKASQTP